MPATKCAHCGKPLERFASRLKASPRQYCDAACMGADRKKQVPLKCPICGVTFTAKASRARQNAIMTCGAHKCIGEIRRRQQLAYRGSKDSRKAECACCAKEFTRKPSQIATAKASYCSKACANDVKRGKGVPKNGQHHPCATCGTPVWRTPGTLLDRVFCSQSCHPKVAMACVICGLIFEVIKSRSPVAKYCSWECKKHALRGSANRSWKGGIARPSTQPLYGSGFTKSVKQSVLNRDNRRCALCGAGGKGRVQVHHIDRKKTDHSMTNLISLCLVCHGKVHKNRLSVVPLSS